ncbi:hypothetical protein ACS0TY_035345 [Phlomoides rotata]
MEYPITQSLRPPILDGSNYPYWKPKMRMYIKSIDERAWRSTLAGWVPPRMTADADNETRVKRELDWTTEENTLASYNSKALNASFTSVDTSMFKIISNCVSSKYAWDRL